MPGFDISDLVRFNPPRHLCEKCCAIDQPRHDRIRGGFGPVCCSVCRVEYVATPHYPRSEFESYLSREARLDVRFSDPIAHGRTLAEIAGRFGRSDRYPPDLHTFYELLLASESFIHITSMNITHVLIGALKLISHRVRVRGIVTGVRDDTAEELTDYRGEAPNFLCHVFESGRDAPHGKLIIVDGLVAIKGSANLTHQAWRNTGRGLEILEIVTDVSLVRDLNNKYFSPIWGRRSTIGDSIDMIAF